MSEPASTLPTQTQPHFAPAPVAASERSILPDVLRGLAIWGILLVNMNDFAGVAEWTQSGLDRLAQAVVDIVANGRFISVFAMLFGWGLAGLLTKYGGKFVAKRQLVLLVVGLLHAVLLWHGDIIQDYALTGLLFILMLRLKTRALLKVSLFLIVSNLMLMFVGGFFASVDNNQMARLATFPTFAENANYVTVLLERLSQLLTIYINLLSFFGHLLGLMGLGALAQRTDLLSQPQQHLPLLKKLAAWGFGLGLPLGVLLAWLNTFDNMAVGMTAVAVRMTGGLIMALGYVGALGYLAGKGKLGGWRIFAANGRLAFSNYLAQSLVMTLIFYPYAGNQFGQWGMGACLLLALAFGAMQLAASQLLLRHYQRGPVEWLVRRLAYGKLSK